MPATWKYHKNVPGTNLESAIKAYFWLLVAVSVCALKRKRHLNWKPSRLRWWFISCKLLLSAFKRSQCVTDNLPFYAKAAQAEPRRIPVVGAEALAAWWNPGYDLFLFGFNLICRFCLRQFLCWHLQGLWWMRMAAGSSSLMLGAVWGKMSACPLSAPTAEHPYMSTVTRLPRPVSTPQSFNRLVAPQDHFL